MAGKLDLKKKLAETLASLGSARVSLRAGGAREPNRINFQHDF